MPIPSHRAIWLMALGLAWPLLLGDARAGGLALATWDIAVLLLMLLDWRRTPGVGAFSVERRLREPLTAFVVNQVTLRLRSSWERPLLVALADAPPPGFDAAGHRTEPGASGHARALATSGELALTYAVTPRSRGRHGFGDLSLRVLGPLGLCWRPGRLPLQRVVSVYPELGGTPPGVGEAAVNEVSRAARSARHGRGEGREFSALRHYLPGDDLRSVDWKATARRGWPVIREWQPERNQTIWILIDCGRALGARGDDGRTGLDRAVEAGLALARAAAARGDRIGAILFGSGVERVIPPVARPSRLGPLVEALHLAEARPVEADLGAALDELLVRQRRRALVVIFTGLSDPGTVALLLARAEVLRRRHLLAVATLADPELVEAATARPATEAGAFARAAAERIAGEREGAERRLAAAGVAVIDAASGGLAAAVVGRYALMKERGLL